MLNRFCECVAWSREFFPGPIFGPASPHNFGRVCPKPFFAIVFSVATNTIFRITMCHLGSTKSLDSFVPNRDPTVLGILECRLLSLSHRAPRTPYLLFSIVPPWVSRKTVSPEVKGAFLKITQQLRVARRNSRAN